MRAFASDNYAGAHPEVLAAIAEANADHAVSYGADPWTAKATELIKDQFGPTAQPWIVFNGTAANVLSLGALTRSWECVVTPDTSHLHVDEAAAPERMAQIKLLTLPTQGSGKLHPAQIEPLLARQGDEHAPQVRVISVANTTELGTVYSVEETRAARRGRPRQRPVPARRRLAPGQRRGRQRRLARRRSPPTPASTPSPSA